MVSLDTTKHESIGKDSKLTECFFTWALVAELLNGVEKLLVEHRDVLHPTMVAALAAIVGIHLPVQSRAGTLLAEVAGEWFDVEETNQGEEFANTVLERCSRQTPFMICFQGKAGLCRASSSLL